MHGSMKLLLINLQGGFPLSRNFYVRTRVKLTCVNKIEAMYEEPRVNLKLNLARLLRLRATLHTLPLCSCPLACHSRSDVSWKPAISKAHFLWPPLMFRVVEHSFFLFRLNRRIAAKEQLEFKSFVEKTDTATRGKFHCVMYTTIFTPVFRNQRSVFPVVRVNSNSLILTI